MIVQEFCSFLAHLKELFDQTTGERARDGLELENERLQEELRLKDQRIYFLEMVFDQS